MGTVQTAPRRTGVWKASRCHGWYPRETRGRNWRIVSARPATTIP